MAVLRSTNGAGGSSSGQADVTDEQWDVATRGLSMHRGLLEPLSNLFINGTPIVLLVCKALELIHLITAFLMSKERDPEVGSTLQEQAQELMAVTIITQNTLAQEQLDKSYAGLDETVFATFYRALTKLIGDFNSLFIKLTDINTNTTQNATNNANGNAPDEHVWLKDGEIGSRSQDQGSNKAYKLIP